MTDYEREETIRSTMSQPANPPARWGSVIVLLLAFVAIGEASSVCQDRTGARLDGASPDRG